MKKRILNKKKLAIFVLIVVCTLSSLGFGIYSLAKYVTQDSKKALVIPANFQFSSDYLKNNNPTYNVYDWEHGISIELYNSININKSEIDVPYTVTVTNGTSNISSGIITTSEDKDTIIITPTNIDDPVIVSVSSNTYDYVLSATFNIEESGNNSYYSFTDNNEYCELTINTNSNNISSLTVNWNSNYIPDNTNPLMETWTGTTGTLLLNRSTKYKFIFFKNTNNICSNITNTEIQNNIITLP